MQLIHLDEIEALPALGGQLQWKPVRHALGISAFGINAWTKGQGEDVIPKHDESASGHEELYLVTEGHATFTVDGTEIDAPVGTAVELQAPSVLKPWSVSRLRAKAAHARTSPLNSPGTGM